LYGVSFFDKSSGIAVGTLGNYAGMILWTTDAGNTWTPQKTGLWSSFYGVSFAGVEIATLVGYNMSGGLTKRTTDGGATWMDQAHYGGMGVSFTDINHGTLVGSSGSIRRTTDGGTTWTAQSSGTSSYLFGVSFHDANTGLAVGENGTIVATSDGGNTWVSQTSGTTNTLYGVCLSDAVTGTVVGGGGIILQTTNGGVTWQNRPSGTSAVLRAVSFADVSNGTAVGYGGTVLRTTDGGVTWLGETVGTGANLYAVSFTDRVTGPTVGDGGIILRTNTPGFSGLQSIHIVSGESGDRPQEFSLDQNYPNPFNPTTKIGFRIEETGLATLKLFDVLGRETATLVNDVMQPGSYKVTLDGSGLASGVYFYRLVAGGFVLTKKLIVQK
jgi:photosystem II stability/assembly factor-like uncharacterized protein